MSQLLPPLLVLLAAGASGIVFTRLLLGRRARMQLLARLAEQLAAATGGNGRTILEDDALEDELARVVRGYQKVEGLSSRVAELEAERVLARLAAKAGGASANEAPAGDDSAEDVSTPAAAGAAAAAAAAAEAAAAQSAEAALILDQARRLTESSFVAGSDALVRVRAALKNLKDWRQRLSASAEGGAGAESAASALPATGVSQAFGAVPAIGAARSAAAESVAPAGANGDTAPGATGAPPVQGVAAAAASQPAAAIQPAAATALAAVFTSLAGDVARLAECARGLRPLAAAAETMAGLGPAGDGDGLRGAVSIREVAFSPGAAPRRQLLLAALRIRGLAAELETGLTGLGTELRVLGRLPVAKPIASDKERASRREGPEPAFLRTLSRLEMQLTEVAADIAGLTRDAEHLSRELKRIRFAANGRPVP